MKIVVVGLNHTTAPIELREQLSFDRPQANLALEQLHATFGHARFVLLSTCNRVELYSVSDVYDWKSGHALATFLAESRDIPLETLQPCLYVHVDREAVEHLFRVTSSLDSLALGESQIVSQVKECFRLACAVSSPGKIINRLFHTAFATSKEVHAGLNTVLENASDFMEWFDKHNLEPKINQLKTAFTQISQHELDRVYGGAQEKAGCRNALDPIFERVANKVFSCVMAHVNNVARERGAEAASKVVTDLMRQAGAIRVNSGGMAK